ncbi:MAG: SWIM zinc finger family protein [Bacteroidetes bacterium]|nr:MAG: SWIM zinc finger family protein [Bacteroidota bacterium]
MNWTEEQVRSFSPDDASTKAGKGLAKEKSWVSFGIAENQALWGECQGSGKNPYRTQIDLANIAFKCTCPSRKFPCKHGLGLMFLYANQPESVPVAELPNWVEEWIGKRQGNAQKSQEKASKPVDEKAKNKRADQRLEKVNQGIEELRLWISDLIRSGIMSAPEKNISFWENFAKKMIDAQAKGLATRVQKLGKIAFYKDGWQSELLDQLSEMYLLTESFKNISTLPENLQTDIKNQIGWTQDQNELKETQGIRDIWAVLAKENEVEDNLLIEKYWFYGANTKQFALFLQFTLKNPYVAASKNLAIPIGASLDAEIVYFPSSVLQRVIIKTQYDSIPAVLQTEGFKNWEQTQDFYAEVLAQNPFSESVPMIVENIKPFFEKEKWFLQDVDKQAVKLTENMPNYWKMLAISGGEFLTIFVVRKKQEILPLGFWKQGKYVIL